MSSCIGEAAFFKRCSWMRRIHIDQGSYFERTALDSQLRLSGTPSQHLWKAKYKQALDFHVCFLRLSQTCIAQLHSNGIDLYSMQKPCQLQHSFLRLTLLETLNETSRHPFGFSTASFLDRDSVTKNQSIIKSQVLAPERHTILQGSPTTKR